jgi:hypothetical protein
MSTGIEGSYSGFINAAMGAQTDVTDLMSKMEQVKDDPSALLGTSLKLMEAQQRLTTMTESFTKSMKACTDAQKAAINSMA